MGSASDGIPDYLLTTAQLNGVSGSATLAAAKVSADVGIGIASYYAGPAMPVVNLAWNLLKNDFWGMFGSDPSYTISHQTWIGAGRTQQFTFVDNVSGITCDNIDSTGASHPLFLMDYDNDGKDDIVTACGAHNGDLYVSQSLGDGQHFQNLFQGLPGTGQAVLSSGLGVAAAVPGARGTCPTCGNEPPPIVVDVDGDSLQDVVTCKDPFTLQVWRRLAPLPNPDATQPPQPQRDFSATPIELKAPEATLPTKGNPNPPPRIVLPLCGDPHSTYNVFDIDGDGTPDLLVHGPSAPAPAGGRGSGTSLSPLPLGWFVLRFSPVAPQGVPQLSWQPVVFDDIGGEKGSAGGAMSVGDFNNDGLLDTWNIDDSKATIWINTGGGVFAAHTMDHPTNSSLGIDPAFRRTVTAVLDYDADGRSDFLENWRVLDNPDSAQFSGFRDYNLSLLPNSQVSQLISSPADKANWFDTQFNVTRDLHFNYAQDFDGDGVVDLLSTRQSLAEDSASGDFGSHISYGGGAASKLLAKVVDGLGNVITVSYEKSAYQHDDKCVGRQWPERCLQQVNGLVSSHSEGVRKSNGDEVSERSYTYHYLNGRMNMTGAGWLGFDRRTIDVTAPQLEGGASLSTTTIEYEPVARYNLTSHHPDGTPAYIYPFAGLPKTITVDQHTLGANLTLPAIRDADYDPRSQTINYWTVELSADNRPYPFMDSRRTSTYDRRLGPGIIGDSTLPFDDNGTVLTTCYETLTPDTYGNVSESLRVCRLFGEDTALDTTDTNVDFKPDPNNWLISFPKTLTIESKTRAEQGAPTVPAADSDQFQSFTFTYPDGMLASVTRNATSGSPAEQQRTTTYDRDDHGNVFQITEETLGQTPRVTQIHYDYSLDPVFPQSTDNALGYRTQMQFDPRWGTPTVVVDPNGSTLLNSYDDFGLPRESSGPDGISIATYAPIPNGSAENAVGHVEQRIQKTVERQGTAGSFGGTTTSVYDNRGRVVRSSTVGLQRDHIVQEQAYDSLTGVPLGKTLPYQVTIFDEAGGVTHLDAPHDTYTYDGLQRLTAVTHPDGTFREMQYASSASLAAQYQSWLSFTTVGVVRTIDETKQHVNIQTTDYRGRIDQAIDGDGNAMSSTYGAFGHLTALFDARGLMTSFSTDPYGRRLLQTDPDTGPTHYTYNGYDELVTSNDPAARGRLFQYDALGRTLSITDSQGAVVQGKTQWTYDQGTNVLGKLTDSFSPATAENPAGNHTHYDYEQNSRGLPQTVTYTIDGTDYHIGLEYDDLARTSRVHYPNLGTGAPIVTRYTYDRTAGALTQLDEVGSGTTKLLWKVSGLQDGYLLSQETFGNQAQASYHYDPKRKWIDQIETTVGGQQAQLLEYTHYDNGQVHQRLAAAMRPREYLYDNLGRLKQTVDQTGQTAPIQATYWYDEIGNITGRPGIGINYNANHPHQVDTVGGNNYHYDLSGNVDSRAGPDIPGGEQSLTYTPFNLPLTISTGEQPTSFEYSADEERLIRRDPGKGTTLYSVSDLYQRKLDISAGTTLEERFRLYAGDRQIGEIVRNGGTDQTLFFHPDHLGSVDTISDSAGNFHQQQFDPFGASIKPSTPPLTRAGFTGQDHDDDLGLIDMKGRLYDPLTARFMSQDPVMQAPFSTQGLNRYSYAFNDPVNNTDPSGFATDPISGLVIFGDDHLYDFKPVSFGNGGATTGATTASEGTTAGNAGLSSAAVGVGLSVLGNVLDTVLTGGPLDGSRAAGAAVKVATPSAHPRGTGSGTNSAQAKNQNTGQPGPQPSTRIAETPLDVIIQTYGRDFGCVMGECKSVADTTLAAIRLLGTDELRALSAILNQVQMAASGRPESKIPSNWGKGTPTKKSGGTRWQDPENQGNGVRIDKGDPNSPQPSQRVDHVLLRHNGKVIGRSGVPIHGSIAENGVEAHIPLSEWLGWSSWFHP